jgi:IS1 family transposase
VQAVGAVDIAIITSKGVGTAIGAFAYSSPFTMLLRVVHNTDRKTLEAHVHRFMLKETTCYTDEWNSYNHIIREHKTVCHAEHEWTRDDDGNGIREVHTNTAEGK